MICFTFLVSLLDARQGQFRRDLLSTGISASFQAAMISVEETNLETNWIFYECFLQEELTEMSQIWNSALHIWFPNFVDTIFPLHERTIGGINKNDIECIVLYRCQDQRNGETHVNNSMLKCSSISVGYKGHLQRFFGMSLSCFDSWNAWTNELIQNISGINTQITILVWPPIRHFEFMTLIYFNNIAVSTPVWDSQLEAFQLCCRLQNWKAPAMPLGGYGYGG